MDTPTNPETIPKYCDCCSHLVACQIFALFFTILRILTIVGIWKIIQGNQLLQGDDLISVLSIVLECLFLMGDVLLLFIGSYKKISVLLTAWKSWNIFIFGIISAGLVIKAIISARFPTTLVIIFGIQGGFFLWAMSVVKKAIKEID